MHRKFQAACAVAALAAIPPAMGQAQRTFVASYGNDTNTATFCGFANPCRSFAAAQTATQSGGEIVALDAAGYGAITITKSISILANPGAYAGISASTGSAVTIATAGVRVRLAGLRLNGVGAGYGITMSDGASLTVENCTVSGFTMDGILVSGNVAVRIIDTLSLDNGQDGIALGNRANGDVIRSTILGNGRVGLFVDGPTTAGTTSIAVTDSISSQNYYGFTVRGGAATTNSMGTFNGVSAHHNTNGFYSIELIGGGAARVSVASSRVTRNAIGFRHEGGTFRSAGNNIVIDNDSNTSGTITTFNPI